MSRRRDRRPPLRSAAGVDHEVVLARQLADLDALYARLPAMECQGLCADSCHTHVDASDAERTRLLRRHGLDLDAPTPDGACPALSRSFGLGRCSVHADRPMICRLWGAAAAMPCPHGCTPDGGRLDDRATLQLLADSLATGGHRDGGLADLLHLLMDDPIAAALVARMLRGDHTAKPALIRHYATRHLDQIGTKSRLSARR